MTEERSEKTVEVAQAMLASIRGQEIGDCLTGSVMALLKVTKTFLMAIPEKEVRQSVAESLLADLKANIDRIILNG